MSDSASLDTARQTALAAIDRHEKIIRAAIITAAVAEGALLLAILMLIDLANPTHKLILLATFLIYLPLGLGMMALGSLINRQSRSILLALQLISEERQAGR